jgi:GNAT superfamily N-acetyltransferase
MPARRATGRIDLDAVSVCLTSAFFHDPVWGEWAFPDEQGRVAPLGRLLRFWVKGAMKHTSVWMTSNAEAAAAWIPPGVSELTNDEEAEFELLVTDLFGPRAGELSALFELFEQHHPHDEPHQYLSLWGTDRRHTGHGIGAALLNENLARIDAERTPAYLESTNPANLPRYEALGFRPRAEFGVPGGPRITTMWREAAGTG